MEKPQCAIGPGDNEPSLAAGHGSDDGGGALFRTDRGARARGLEGLGRRSGDDVLLKAGGDVARKDGEDVNAGGSKLHAQALAVGRYGMFGGAIERAPRRLEQAQHGADMDEHAAALFAHDRHEVSIELLESEDVELEHALAVFGIGLPGGSIDASTSIVDDDVDNGVAGKNARGQAGTKGGVGQIALDPQHLRALHLGCGSGDEHQAGAVALELAGERIADALTGTGDHDRLIEKRRGHWNSVAGLTENRKIMPEELLPLFPLQLVLLPGTTLPLHIFEDRYREMMNELLVRGGEFGVVQTTNNGILNAGCSAVIERVLQRHQDGRLDILTVGRRRFRVFSLNEERSFLRGSVEFFDDEPELPIADLRRASIQMYEQVRQTDAEGDLEELDVDDPQLSFQIAAAVTDLDLRQLLLVSKSENERLRRLLELMPAHLEQRLAGEKVRSAAPKNGHGKWPNSLS